jgi:hypothetical protein
MRTFWVLFVVVVASGCGAGTRGITSRVDLSTQASVQECAASACEGQALAAIGCGDGSSPTTTCVQTDGVCHWSTPSCQPNPPACQVEDCGTPPASEVDCGGGVHLNTTYACHRQGAVCTWGTGPSCPGTSDGTDGTPSACTAADCALKPVPAIGCASGSVPTFECVPTALGCAWGNSSC